MTKKDTLSPPDVFTIPVDNPYAWYKNLRAKETVHRVSAGQWMITGYDDAVSLLQNPLCSHWGQDYETQAMMTPVQKAVAKTLHALAPGNDLPYRKMIMHQLAARNLKSEEDYIKGVAKKTIEKLKAKSEFDLMTDYAHPFTFRIISHIIGIPENKIEELNSITETLNGSYLNCITGDKNTGTENSFLHFLEEFIETKKNAPGDDLCSLLLQATNGNEEPHFITSMLILLFYAGHENMMNFLGNAVIALHENIPVQQKLRLEPDLMHTGIDELLRFDSPLQFIVLYTTEDIVQNKKNIPSGSQLLIGVGAANRDPDVFPNPDELDMNRKPAHLSFGAGAFRCIGARLARLEGITGINNLLHHITSFTLCDQTVQWRKGNFVQRGPSSLNLKVNWNDRV